MDELNSDPPELSPNSLALLEIIIRSKKPLRTTNDWMPNASQSVRYLTGALSAEESRTMDEKLSAAREARDRLRSIRSTLRKLQALSWAEVAAKAGADDETAPIARAWLELVSERIAATPIAQTWRRSRDWATIRKEVTAGLQEAQAAWMAFLSFIEQWKLELGKPQVAIAKGSEPASPVFGDGSIAGAEFSAEIDLDGTLHLTLRLPSSEGLPDISLQNKHVYLALSFHGELWPLASFRLEEAVGEWIVPDIGTMLGLPAGRIPPDLIRIDIGDDASPPLSASGRNQQSTLLAEVLDRRGKPAPGSPAAIELFGAPRWEAERLILEIVIPTATRDAFPAYHLEIELILSSHDAQYLGAWPVSLWGEGPQTLTVVCPGSPDVAVPFTSCLRTRLRAQPIA